MMCYKDQTFCEFNECKHFGDREDDPDNCFRSLTNKVKDKASKLHLPICQYTDKPPCFEK